MVNNDAQLSYDIVSSAIKVHKELGPGLLEHICEKCLGYELIKNGFSVEHQYIASVVYDDLKMDIDLRSDMFIEKTIVIEIKATTNILSVHEAQFMTYMKLVQAPQGILLNFFTDNITKSARYYVNGFFKILPEG